MSPLPCWLGGAHFVALNMSNPDLAVQLHFALFNGSGGFVLKPPEMLAVDADDSADGDDKAFWPPPRERLHRMTMKVVSLHELPKVRRLSNSPNEKKVFLCRLVRTDTAALGCLAELGIAATLYSVAKSDLVSKEAACRVTSTFLS
eukprot:1302441-Prymnesium_polylepis.2